MPRRAILYGLARIHELGLAQNGTTGFRRGALKQDQGSVADRLDNSIA